MGMVRAGVFCRTLLRDICRGAVRGGAKRRREDLNTITTTDDPYAELRQATPEELLEAAIKFYSDLNPITEIYLKMGFALARPDGWMHVAPAWLKKVEM